MIGKESCLPGQWQNDPHGNDGASMIPKHYQVMPFVGPEPKIFGDQKAPELEEKFFRLDHTPGVILYRAPQIPKHIYHEQSLPDILSLARESISYRFLQVHDRIWVQGEDGDSAVFEVVTPLRPNLNFRNYREYSAPRVRLVENTGFLPANIPIKNIYKLHGASSGGSLIQDAFCRGVGLMLSDPDVKIPYSYSSPLHKLVVFRRGENNEYKPLPDALYNCELPTPQPLPEQVEKVFTAWEKVSALVSSTKATHGSVVQIEKNPGDGKTYQIEMPNAQLRQTRYEDYHRQLQLTVDDTSIELDQSHGAHNFQVTRVTSKPAVGEAPYLVDYVWSNDPQFDGAVVITLDQTVMQTVGMAGYVKVIFKDGGINVLTSGQEQDEKLNKLLVNEVCAINVHDDTCEINLNDRTFTIPLSSEVACRQMLRQLENLQHYFHTNKSLLDRAQDVLRSIRKGK